MADALWAEVELLGKQSGQTTSKTCVYLLEAAIKALRKEQERMRTQEDQNSTPTDSTDKP